MPSYTAPWVLLPQGLCSGWAVVLDDGGRVVEVTQAIPADAQQLTGILSPGFVNAHCHLELSAYASMLPEHTGMAGFIERLQAARQQQRWTTAENDAHITQALQQAHASGTVAIADICNDSSSFTAISAYGQVYVHHLVECFGLRPAAAQEIISQAARVCALAPGPANITAHAPYSMSADLLQEVCAALTPTLSQVEREIKALMQGDSGGNIFSIHLLESEEERQLLEAGSGPLHALFTRWGLPMQYDPPDALAYVLQILPPSMRGLFVHLTQATAAELQQLAAREAWFCLCPRANLYIHDTLPRLDLFTPHAARVVVGTDSLAGNHSLDLLAELLVLQQHWPGIDCASLLRMATQQGAACLQLDWAGSFEAGKRPGVVHIEHVDAAGQLTPHSKARLLVNAAWR